MAEPFELIDEWEVSIYDVVIRQLRKQFGDVVDADFFSSGYFASQADQMAMELAPVLEEILKNGMVMTLPGEMTPLVAQAFDNMSTYAAQNAATLIKRINGTTEQQVNELIQRSIEEGWGIDELTDNLSPWFSEVRARRIAVTETTNAYIGGAEIGLNELRGQGLNVVARWLTANDDFVCSICAPRHGKIRGDGWTDMGAAHVGCRCDVAIEEVPIEEMR